VALQPEELQGQPRLADPRLGDEQHRAEFSAGRPAVRALERGDLGLPSDELGRRQHGQLSAEGLGAAYDICDSHVWQSRSLTTRH
jgi:hypothetical protein